MPGIVSSLNPLLASHMNELAQDVGVRDIPGGGLSGVSSESAFQNGGDPHPPRLWPSERPLYDTGEKQERPFNFFSWLQLLSSRRPYFPTVSGTVSPDLFGVSKSLKSSFFLGPQCLEHTHTLF